MPREHPAPLSAPSIDPAVRALLAEARAFLDTRHNPQGKLSRPATLIARIDAVLGKDDE